MSPGQTGLVPGTKWVCPRDKPRFSSYLHGGSPVCPWDKPSLSLGHSGDEGRQKEFMCQKFMSEGFSEGGSQKEVSRRCLQRLGHARASGGPEIRGSLRGV